MTRRSSVEGSRTTNPIFTSPSSRRVNPLGDSCSRSARSHMRNDRVVGLRQVDEHLVVPHGQGVTAEIAFDGRVEVGVGLDVRPPGRHLAGCEPLRFHDPRICRPRNCCEGQRSVCGRFWLGRAIRTATQTGRTTAAGQSAGGAKWAARRSRVASIDLAAPLGAPMSFNSDGLRETPQSNSSVTSVPPSTGRSR